MNDKTKTKHVLLDCMFLCDLSLTLQLEIELLLALHYEKRISKVFPKRGKVRGSWDGESAH